MPFGAMMPGDKSIVELKLPGQVLSSKIAATILRKDIQAAVASNKRVLLDCSEVQSMDNIFSDELIGVLVGSFGPAYVMRNLIFDRAPRAVHLSVANSIKTCIQGMSSNLRMAA